MRPHTTIADKQTALHDLMTALGYTATVPGKHYHRAVGKREIYIRVEMRSKSLFYGSTHPMRIFGIKDSAHFGTQRA